VLVGVVTVVVVVAAAAAAAAVVNGDNRQITEPRAMHPVHAVRDRLIQ